MPNSSFASPPFQIQTQQGPNFDPLPLTCHPLWPYFTIDMTCQHSNWCATTPPPTHFYPHTSICSKSSTWFGPHLVPLFFFSQGRWSFTATWCPTTPPPRDLKENCSPASDSYSSIKSREDKKWQTWLQVIFLHMPQFFFIELEEKKIHSSQNVKPVGTQQSTKALNFVDYILGIFSSSDRSPAQQKYNVPPHLWIYSKLGSLKEHSSWMFPHTTVYGFKCKWQSDWQNWINPRDRYVSL